MSEPEAWRAALVRGATWVQTGSAATLGSVLVTHLAAPVVAGLVGPAGLDRANQTMLLGRVYYQSPLLEPVVVWGALGAHLLSSIVRRALMRHAKSKGAWDVRRWTWGQWHSAAGFVLAPVLLLHVWTNRVAPATATAPIAALSPSELDMAYVGFGLTDVRYRAVSWGAYTLLIASTAVHGLGGAPKMARRLGRKAVSPRAAAYAALGLGVLLALGTSAIARDGVDGVGAAMLERVRRPAYPDSRILRTSI